MGSAGEGVYVLARFLRLPALYRRAGGEEWGGQGFEGATGRVVTRSHVTNLMMGRLQSSGSDKLAALVPAMNFPPRPRSADEALLAAVRDPTAKTILEEFSTLDGRGRELPRAARGIPRAGSPPGAGGSGRPA